MDKTMEYRGYEGSIEVSMEDNVLYGHILHIRGLINYPTPQQLKKAFEEAVNDYLENGKQASE